MTPNPKREGLKEFRKELRLLNDSVSAVTDLVSEMTIIL